MFEKKMLMVMFPLAFLTGVTFGASSSSAGKEVCAYECDGRLERYLKDTSIEKIIKKLIIDCDYSDKAYARLQYVLSDACERHKEVTQKIKDELLLWAIEDSDLNFVHLMIRHGADAYARVLCDGKKQRVILLKSLSMVLSDHYCEEFAKEDIKKMILLLKSKSLMGRLIPKQELRIIKKMHKKIIRAFDEKGLVPFKEHVLYWREIVQLLGVSREIRKLTYPLLLPHDTTDYQKSFCVLRQCSPIEQFAVACDIYHFTWCIAYNLMYGKKAYDLSVYIHCGRTTAVQDEENCKRCYKDARSLYDCVKLDVQNRIDDARDSIELKNQRYQLSRRIAEARASSSSSSSSVCPDPSSIVAESVTRSPSLGLRRSPQLTQEMVRSMSFANGLSEIASSSSD